MDFTAVLGGWPDAGQFDALAAAHAAVFEAHQHPHLDGFHLLPEHLARRPEECPDLPCMFDGTFRPPGRFNLTSYWSGVAEALVARPHEASTPAAAAWCVLGVSRLHHVLATGQMTSKSCAGRYALTAFGPQWHPIVHEALRAREHPAEPSDYDPEPSDRARDTTAFTVMAIEAGLALGAVAAGAG